MDALGWSRSVSMEVFGLRRQRSEIADPRTPRYQTRHLKVSQAPLSMELCILDDLHNRLKTDVPGPASTLVGLAVAPIG